MPILHIHNLQNHKFFKERMEMLHYNANIDQNGLSIENKLKFKGLDIRRLDESNFTNSKDFIDIHYKEIIESQTDRYEANYQTCLKLAEEIKGNIDFNKIRLFRNSITFCPLEKLSEFFNNTIAPNFFAAFPKGKIYLIRVPVIYRSRAAGMRILYSLKHYPLLDLAKVKGFNTLRSWNFCEPHNIYRLVLSILFYINPPSVLGFMASHDYLLDFIFIPNKPLDIDYSFSWFNQLESEADFARERIDIEGDIELPNIKHFFKNYLFDEELSFNDSIDLIDWGIDVSGKLINILFDVTNFLSRDRENTVDPIYALEYLHSVVHMLRDNCFILSSTSSYQSKAICFRVADILSSLASQGVLDSNETEYFKELFRNGTRDKLKSIFDVSHSRVVKNLSPKTNDLYGAFRSTILESVWVPNKRFQNGILIRNQTLTRENLIDHDRFISEVLRTLRNTHHGYFSRGNRTTNKSQYLSLIDGNVPDSLPSLATLWCLAFLQWPERIVGKPSDT